MTVRIEFDDATRLEALKEKTQADDYGEILTNALRLYEALIERHEAGKPLYQKTDAGDYVVFPIFTTTEPT
jgi:hypothetical protein